MIVRRAAAWVSTILVAIVVAFAVPVSQLRTISVIRECCCPDPTDCGCPHQEPDHDGERPSQPTMRACQSTETMAITPQLPVFHAPAVALAPAIALAAIALAHSFSAPHPAPAPARPDAPS